MNMKFNIKFVIFIAILIGSLPSCNEFLDVNDDPHKATNALYENLLPNAIERTSSAHFNVARNSSYVTQQIGLNDGGYPKKVNSGGAWIDVYLRVMPTCNDIIDRANADGAFHYVGIAKVLKAINLGLLADNWEAVPYSEGLKGVENLTPKYDSQEDLYKSINQLLDEAIIAFDKDNGAFDIEGDMIYGGDVSKWMKVANALKARYALHLSKKGMDNQAILDYLDKGLSDNADDFQLGYNDINNNKWYIIAKDNNTGNYTVAIGGYIIHLLQDSTKTATDPRLDAIAGGGQMDGDYVGVGPEDVPYASSNHNTPFTTENTWLSNIDSPIQFLTYAECKFIEAEAALSIDKNRAYQAYLDGIAANMAKIGVDGTDYLADPGVAVGADNLTLSHIMKEKYIATYLMPETWVDMRRHLYNPSIYTDFVIPDPLMEIGGAIERFEYPTSELSRNATEVQKVMKPNILVMWRDL